MYLVKKHKNLFIYELKSYIIIAIVSIVFSYITCPGCFSDFNNSFKHGLFSFLAWTFLWKGNEYITDYINKKISWVNQPMQRFIIGIISMIGYTTLMLFLIQYFFYLIGYTAAKIAPFGVYVFGIGITALISLIFHSVAFLKSWRQAEINMEKLKNERLSSQYEALKNQVNPHFLFNSLNALTSLVYENQDQAAKFIQQLSKVYRYVLDNKEKETVPLDTELQFVESFLFLQKIRYGENLQFNIQIPEDIHFKVAPLSIQMLIENAIKHNVISADEPLTIDINIDGDGYLITRNTLQVKNIINEYSGIGLENIKARYLYFTKKPVIVEKTLHEFIVKLPLIKLNNDDIKTEETLFPA